MKRKLLPNESLFSYLVNYSRSLGVDIFVLLEILRSNEKFRIHSGDLRRIDFYPSSLMSQTKLIKMTGLTNEDVEKSSFSNVIQTFNVTDKGEGSRILRKLIREELVYCPQCLEASSSYPLLWKVEGIDICTTHVHRLSKDCGHCGEKIRYQEIREINRCPHCSRLLSKSSFNSDLLKKSELTYQIWLTENWNYLLKFSEDRKLSPTETAINLLFILNEQQIHFKRGVVRGNLKHGLESLLQIARGSSSRMRSIHLSRLMNILFSMKVDIPCFLRLEVPKEFIDSLHKKSISELARMKSCGAPWCYNFGQVGTLKWTGIQNTYSSGHILSYYMICSSCGCEYALNEERSLIERGYFIKSYEVLKTIDISEMTWPEREKLFGLERGRIRRVLAYFHDQGVIRVESFIGKVDSELLTRFTKAVSEGVSLEHVRNWEAWKNYDHFLLHRYHSFVIKAIMESSTEKKDIKIDLYTQNKIKNVCKDLTAKNVTISLPIVALAAGMSVTTMRNKGCTKIVALYREIQLKIRRDKRIREFQQNINSYLVEQQGQRVYMEKIYDKFKMNYLYLKRYSPQLLQKIEEMKVKHNSKLLITEEVDWGESVGFH